MENDEINEPEAQEKAQPPRPRRKVLKVCLRYVVILAMMPVVFALIAALMLIGQDVTAPSWVAEKIQTRAEAALDGGEISFEEITLNLGTDFHPRVRMDGVTVSDPDGARVLAIESLSGLMSPRGVIFERKALMQDVILTGMDLNLRRDGEGNLSISFSEDRDAIAIEDTLDAVFAQLDAAFEIPALEALENVRLSKFEVTYADEATGTELIGHSKDLRLNLKGEERQLATEITIKGASSEESTRISIGYNSEKASREAQLQVDLNANTGADLASLLPQLSALGAINAPTSVSFTTRVDEAGQTAPLAAEINLGAGSIMPKADADPIPLDGLSATATHNPDTAQINLQDIQLVSDRLSLTGAGQLTLDADQGHIAQFQFQDVSVPIPEEFPEPLQFDKAFADLRLQTSPLRVDIGALTLNSPDISMQTSGYFHKGNNGWSLALDVAAPEASRDTILTYWPTHRSPNLRRWLTNNLKTAQVETLSGALRINEGERANWSLGFGFSETEVRVVKDTPHIKDAKGYASFAQGAFGLVITEGHISAAEGGRIDVAGTTIDIADMSQKGGPLEIQVQATSTLTAALSVLDQSPVRPMQKAGLPVDIVNARSAISGTVTFPRVNPIPPDAIRFDITSDLSRVSSANLVPNRALSARNLLLDADNEGLTLRGTAQLDGVPLTGRYTQTFGVPGSALEADMEISPETLAAFNIRLPPGTVSGRGQGALRVAIARDQPPTFELNSNLRGLRVAVPPVGWSKPPNAEGTLYVQGRLGDRPEVSDLQVSGGGLAARGQVTLKPDGQLDAARFSQLQIGNWFNAPLTLRGRGAGRPPAVEINGGGLDLRRASFGPRQGESGPVDIALDRMQVASGIALTNFRGSFTGTGGFNGTFQGNLNGGPAISGTVVPQNGRSAIRLRSDDAGGIVKAAGLLKGGNGGVMELVLSPVGAEGTFDGALSVRGLRVREAPAMAALLDAISVVGLLQQLDGQGLSFDEVDAKFRLSPSQLIVSESSAVGPGLGISLDGVYALASKQLDFQGVVSPFYLLNGIGSVLTRKGEGLIGFNFTVRGDSSSPQVVVNPLSALTPGMFREIFRRPPPQVGQ